MHTQLSLHLKNPNLTLQKQEFPASYTLQFKQDSDAGASEVAIELSPTHFEVLLNQGRVLIPSQQITLTSSQENATWREAAWPLFRLNDKEWQYLIREISTDKLIGTLWFLNDLQLARKGCSQKERIDRHCSAAGKFGERMQSKVAITNADLPVS